MEPIGMEHRGGKGWMNVHRCISCGKVITNKVAEDDDTERISHIQTERLK
jgi:hypothetical protein